MKPNADISVMVQSEHLAALETKVDAFLRLRKPRIYFKNGQWHVRPVILRGSKTSLSVRKLRNEAEKFAHNLNMKRIEL